MICALVLLLSSSIHIGNQVILPHANQVIVRTSDVPDVAPDGNAISESDFHNLKPEKQKELIDSALKYNFPLDLQEYWSRADPQATLGAMHTLGEPLSATALMALQSKLPLYRTEDDMFTAAAFLYRYNKKSGYDALFELAKRGNSNACAVLAANKETASLKYVLACLKNSCSNEYLIRSLGRWRDPTISKALVTALEQHPTNAGLALAVTHQNDKSAIGILRRCRSSSREETNRLLFSLALVRLKDAKNKELLHEVITTAQMSDAYTVLAFESMRYLTLAEGRQFARDRIEKYLHEKLSNTTSTYFTSEGIDAVEKAVAYLSEVNPRGEPTRTLTLKALKRTYNLGAFEYVNGFSLSALRAGNNPDVVNNLVGSDIATRQSVVLAMKLHWILPPLTLTERP